MTKFILLDRSLGSLGGHHFEYDVPMLRVAESLGYEVVYGISKRFKELGQLPSTWQVHAKYEVPPTSLYSTLELLRRRMRQFERRSRSPRGRWQKLLDCLPQLRDAWSCWRDERQHHASAKHFARVTADLFRAVPLEHGDQVFLSDASPIDLAGLAQFFESNARARSVDWHLLFHIPIFQGSIPAGAVDSPPVRQLRSTFCKALRAVTADRLHFYATTDALAEQFNRLDVARFQTLHLPAGPSFRPSLQQDATPRPLRAASLGAVRREKGKGQWAHVIDALWPDCLDSGDLQLVLQAKSLRKLPAALRQRLSRAPADRRADRPPPIRIAPWPLSSSEYARLIRESDIGVMLYRRDNYYFRASGVLVEMLNSGIPVIVMAGTSLAEQIAEEVYAHQERLLQTTRIAGSVDASAVDWRRNGDHHDRPDSTAAATGAMKHVAPTQSTRLTLGGPKAALTGSLRPVAEASHLLIQFGWPEPFEMGTCVELLVRQTDGHRHTRSVSREIVGRRNHGRRTTILIPLTDGASEIELCWKNAFSEAEVAIDQVAFHFLAAENAPGASLPSGAVGLIAADIEQVPRLLRELIRDHAHYRRTARAFAAHWAPWHSHAHVVKTLLTSSSTGIARTAKRVSRGRGYNYSGLA